MNTPSPSGAKPSELHLTRALVDYAVQSRFPALPPHVQNEAQRAFVNWVGCALGGSGEAWVRIAADTVAAAGGHPEASIIGLGRRVDLAGAAFVNCISSSGLAFDDAHLGTVTHPSGPVAAALYALSQTRRVSGEEFLNALALGIEIQCRLSNVLLLPPAQFNAGFYVTGLTAPIGTALALGRVLGLDAERMAWAAGLAASQSSGFRGTRGTMTGHFRPGHAARAAVWAVQLAANGFTCSDDSLEAEKGFIDVFSSGADLSRAMEGLGTQFELLLNAYKPYPCGIVIHAAIDACLEIVAQTGTITPAAVALRVNPMALSMTGRRDPATPLQSQVSLYHWTAAALLRGAAGLAEMRQDCIDDPEISALRARIDAAADPAIGRGEAVVDVTLQDGRRLHAHVTEARGSAARPLTDAELDAKFTAQARLVLPHSQVDGLLRRCRTLATSSDVGRDIAL